MSQTSIFEKRWLDLVFEGKNKAYGAYQLRLENRRTTILAMLYALLFIGGVSGGGFLLSSFGNKPGIDSLSPIENDSIVVVDLDYPKPPIEPIAPKPPVDAPPSTSEPIDDWRTDPVVAPPIDANTDPIENPPATPAATPGSGTDTGGVTDGGTPGGTSTGTENIPDNSPVGTAVLDRQPMFPGGMQAFYTYVGNNFEKPEANDEAAIRIFVSFVIEKDGTMTDIVVKNKPGYALEKEAVRVLKSLRKKWTPGVKNGQPMRVLYTLPITIKPE
ncbi:MAG: energy transducer TonB [Flavobacterium sp.]|uniref:energy transducer TonB n=1 Tax=Flavobacterium sp. TaxID=239 RepID=UPI001210C46D|nr:energy transducer TonB [Flavobacterium sp.]RZJ67084.1 MAG: energy transducer TonB [Flavobacterium sp.]